MKKFYAFVAAALISVCAFASKDVVPSDAVLAEYYNKGNVCVCIFVPADMACNDIVLTGSFNGWKTTNDAFIPFEAIEGYDGWYVASYEPEAEPAEDKGLQAKPIMKDGDGKIRWDYLVGTATAIRGGVTVVDGYAGEVDLINYSVDAPNVYTVDSWRNNPCTVVYHNYTVSVVNSSCNPYSIPFIIGDFNNWSKFVQMQFDLDKSQQLGKQYFYYSFKAAEGAEYYIVSGLLAEDGITIADQPAWKDEAYPQKWIVDAETEEGSWVRIAGEGNNGNFKLGENANIEFDWSDADKYRWTRCLSQEEAEYTVIRIKLPVQNRPSAVEIIGTFDDWQGTAMELLDYGYWSDYWFAEVEARPSDYFKIRSAGSWDRELELYNAEDDTWSPILDDQLKFKDLWMKDSWKGIDCKMLEFDWSDSENYRWTYWCNFKLSCDEKYGKVSGSNGTYSPGTKLTISAEANYGYHFVGWSDGNTNNPRTIVLSEDMDITAIFAPNIYTISDNSNPAQGYIAGAGQYEYQAEARLVATPNYGYHFTQWSDGEKESSRVVTVTQDLAFMALFAPNKYTFTASCDEKYGKVIAVNGEYDYLTQLAITAEANYGYHFVEWSDGNTDNPRVLTLTESTALTATFAPNTYTISDNSNKEQGYIAGAGEYEYLASVRVEATPVRGYLFTKWSDGSKENPRTIEVTKDIELIALFDYQLTGNCGKDNALTWTFDPSAMALNITGKGSLSDNYTYGTFIGSLTIGNEVSVIGSEAFAEFAQLTNIIIGSSVKVLEERAFYNCRSIESTTCYSQRPPTVNTNALYGLDYSTIVYVPADYLNNYQMHDAWGLYDVRPFGATTTTVAADEVNVEPTSNTADVTWPVVDNAATYELTIKDKDGNVICTLVFNANGQLTSIAFAAPSRTQTAAQVAGFTFTVTGLDSGSSYSFTMEAKDSQGEVLDTKQGSFTTAESGIVTAVDNASLDASPVKFLRNGQLFILRGDKTYTIQGQEVR